MNGTLYRFTTVPKIGTINMLKKITFVCIITFFASISIFTNDSYSTDFQEIKKLLANDAQAGDFFGVRVSISGDYAIVGASHEDTGGNFAGAAYIYFKDQGGTDNWGEVTKLVASDAEPGDYFGRSVSISGDYAIVGAFWEEAGG